MSSTNQKKPAKKRRWLVQPYIPMGEVTLLTGDRRAGKGLWCAHVAAAASNAKRTAWDLCEDELPRHHVVWVTRAASEDTSEEITTRFEVAGGNFDMFTHLAFDGDLKQLQAQLQRIEGHKLVILDPIQVAIEDLTSRNVRREMEALVGLARATDSTLVAIRHLLKSGQGGRGRGEVADVVRSEVVLGPHPDDQDLVVIAHAPSSYGQGDPVAFRRTHAAGRDDDVPALVPVIEEDWDDDIKWEDLLPAPTRRRKKRPRTRRDIISDWLRDLLESGPKERPEILRVGKRRHFAERTIERAASDLGVIRTGGAFGTAIWSLAVATPGPTMSPSTAPAPTSRPTPVATSSTTAAPPAPVSAPNWQAPASPQTPGCVDLTANLPSATPGARNGRTSRHEWIRRMLDDVGP